MARDIEEFLRRAAERRNKQKARRPPAPRPQQPAQRKPPQQRRPPQQQPPKQRPVKQKPRIVIEDDIQIIEKRDAFYDRESVSQHVERHIDTSDITEHTSHLGDRVRNEAAIIDATVKKHLNHDLTELDDRPTATDDAPPAVVGNEANPMALELLKILASPGGVRQAILMKEILNRPTFDDDDE